MRHQLEEGRGESSRTGDCQAQKREHSTHDKVYTTPSAPRLLIIDEIRKLPIDRVGAALFFQLISRRCKRGPIILTGNQRFGAWGEVV
jgi:DNA replication protein DnaC